MAQFSVPAGFCKQEGTHGVEALLFWAAVLFVTSYQSAMKAGGGVTPGAIEKTACKRLSATMAMGLQAHR